jgi:competence protein ComEA
MKEAPMSSKVQVNLANPAELLELPGVGPEQARAILEFRAVHGPIQNAAELATILRAWPVSDTLWDRVEFDPSAGTTPEAPGA